MNDIEKKLANYRIQKEREAKYNKLKDSFRNSLASYFTSSATSRLNENEESTECLLKSESVGNIETIETIEDNLSNADSFSTEDNDHINCCSYMDCVYYTLCFILWATVYIIFIKLQFGTVYLILSGLIGMYLNTRTGPKSKNEVSAYSVFNKDCKSIDGTLKAEQFEREIRYGPSVVR